MRVDLQALKNRIDVQNVLCAVTPYSDLDQHAEALAFYTAGAMVDMAHPVGGVPTVKLARGDQVGSSLLVRSSGFARTAPHKGRRVVYLICSIANDELTS